MADLKQVMQALRNADAAGNTEDAKRLAQIAQRMKSEQPDKPKGLGAMPFVNRAIAETVGAPVDLLTSAMNLVPGVDIQDPFMGGKDIKRAMGFYGVGLPPEGKQPETIPEHMGQVIGDASSLLIPAGASVKMASKGAGLTGRVASSIWESMVKHPYLTMTSELTGAGAAGAGRGIAKKEFPGRPGTQTGIEIASGLAGGAVPTALVHTPTATAIRAGRNVFYKLATPLTKKGATHRAGEFIKKQTAQNKLAVEEVGKETIGKLPPAIATGEKKIIALYKSLIGQDPVTDHEAIEAITNSIKKLEGEMRKLGYGSPELLQEITEKRIAALEFRMDRRALSATNKAQEKLDALPVSQRKAAESRIVRDELHDAMIVQRAENKKLWNAVEKDSVVGFENTRRTYNDLRADLGKAQYDDIPSALKKSKITTSSKKAGEKVPAGFVTQKKVSKKTSQLTTLREMQSLRSKLLETSRNARKNGEWNKSRIAEDVADAILEDLDIASLKGSFVTREEAVRIIGSATEDAADMVGKAGIRGAAIKLKNGEIFEGATHHLAMEKYDAAGYSIRDWKKLVDNADGFVMETPKTSNLRIALADTRRFKKTFESGEPGKLLGYSKSGSPAINPDLALEVTVGRFGERGAIDLNKVVVSPKAHQATKRYLGRSFVDYAVSGGKVNPVKAKKWLRTNEAILDNYPDLKNQMSDARQSQVFADEVNLKISARKKALRDPRVSESAKFLNRADIGREIDGVFKSAHPSREASHLVKLSTKDASGNALYGLRAGFVEHMLDKATVGVFNDIGEQTISGKAILNFIKKNESTFRTVFDNKQINRMKRIGTELAKIEMFHSSPYGKPKIDMDDWASKLLALAGRLGGAELGGRTGGGSMGGSLQHAQIISGRAKNFMNWISKDKAQQLVQDAILADDPKLLKSMLNPISKPRASKKDIIILNKNLNLWLASTGKRVFEDIEKEDIYSGY